MKQRRWKFVPKISFLLSHVRFKVLKAAQNLLGCTAVFLIECRPTFQMYVLPPSSGRWVTNCPDDEGSTYLWNVGRHSIENTIVHRRRFWVSYYHTLCYFPNIQSKPPRQTKHFLLLAVTPTAVCPAPTTLLYRCTRVHSIQGWNEMVKLAAT
jgi:hypothetical protein